MRNVGGRIRDNRSSDEKDGMADEESRCLPVTMRETEMEESTTPTAR